MYVKEKRKALEKYCYTQSINCRKCALYDIKSHECSVKGACFDEAPDEMIEKLHMTVFPVPVSHEQRVEYIRSKQDENELLCQLAEEAAELSKAASKLARVIRGKNPTPVTHKEAFDNVLEELADVRVCMMALGYDRYDYSILMLMPDKIKRWVERLRKM